MEAPEYLDLDEIDFSDDAVYSVTSLKTIPELSRRTDGPAEERPAPAINWSRSVSSHSGGGIKPTGLAEVHSKFRPVKRVSPLKHQPETTDSDSDGKVQGQGLGESGEGSKEEPSPDKPTHASSSSDGLGGKAKGLGTSVGVVGGNNPQPLFGELEHYDLDMDEILDVPYIKSNQQMSTLPRVPHDKRSVTGSNLGGGTLERIRGGGLKSSALPLTEPLSLGGSSSQTQYCVLSPVKWSDLRKSKSMDPDLHHHHRSSAGGGYQPELLSSGLLSCSSSLSSFSDADKLLSARVYPDSQSQRPAMEPPGGPGLMFPLPGCTVGRQDSSKPWAPGPGVGGSGGSRGFGGGGGAAGEVDEETKKNQNIINIVREGQISLLPHLAADNLELIRDEDSNNLLHISASQGHADCLQHLTSLMGEDGLNERNNQQLTPAGLGVKNGHLECVRWMVSETEAIAELSCTREHPSLIHYAARYGQEKVLLWLLQFMQEQAISLDEVDQNGNTAVHVAAQYGHLTCIQTLVEYGANVTVQNQQGERPSQSAERQGHTTCARYLVVVETCMSLASQVVKLTKQLNEQAAERMALQKQLQRLMDPSKAEGTPSLSPSSHQPSGEAWPEMMLTAEGTPGDGHWLVRQGGVGPDSVLRQLLGKDMSESLCPRERLPPAGGLSREGPCGPGAPGGRRTGLVDRRELKLARLKQIMQRSLSESDSDGYPQEEGKNQGTPSSNMARPDRPSHLPVTEEDPVSNHLHLMMKKHLPSSSSSSTAERKLAFSLSGSKSVDSIGYNPSPTSSDPDATDGKTPDASSDVHDPANGQKLATSPKSALKSPSSRRKTSQNLKLRVTFDEQVHKSSTQEAEPAKGHHGKERTSTGSSESKRSFGTFRSIMETLSGNTNHNNNSSSQSGSAVKQLTCQNSPGRKSDSKSSPGGGKGKSKSSNV
ncbi:synphilin-1 [Mastacembelus armatus]|uniref:Synuclein, alpha interacting protein n=1 Tax=Mastacembelus armatus TaxID=205130 RepID=A0A3Q3SLC4_9TELE|nr:synphilin-1 [Mastacembelus armatus]XP_026176757.1 synphilin-1 [Mastacembelus armatus]